MVANLFRSLMLSIAILISGAASAQVAPFDSPDLNRDSVRVQEQIATEIEQALGRLQAPGDQYREQGETAMMRGDPRGALQPFAAAFIANPRD